MLSRFLAFILVRPVSGAMLTLAALVVGGAAFRSLPSNLAPDVEYPRLSLALGWRSAPPETIESVITAPLEGELSKIHGLKTLSSVSSEGRARLTLEFHPDTQMDMARLEINERLSNLMETLPREVSPPQLSPYVPEEIERMQGFLVYTLSANRSPGEVRRYAEERLALPLRSARGVAEVEILGGGKRHISVELDRSKMEGLRINPDEVTTALQDAYLTVSGARRLRAQSSAPRLDDAPRGENEERRGELDRLAHATVTQSFSRIEDLPRLPVAIRPRRGGLGEDSAQSNAVAATLRDNDVVRLGDVARIYDDFAEPTSFYRLNGKETVTLRLRKEPDADVVAVADRVFETMRGLERALPEDFALVKESDASEKMRAELADLYGTILYAALAAGLFLFIVFRRDSAPRATAIALASVALALAFAACAFALCGLGLNVVTIAAILLGFGIAIDNAIVMTEYLERVAAEASERDDDARGRLSFLRYLAHARAMATPLLGSALTTAAVIAPLVFLQTELRAYMADFALASLALVFSSVAAALCVTPLLCYYWLYRPSSSRFSPVSPISEVTRPSIFFRAYAFALSALGRFRKTAFLGLALLGGVPIWLLPSSIETPYIAPLYNAVFDSPLYGYCKPYLQSALGGAWNIFSNRLPRGDMWQIGGQEYLAVALKLPNGNRIERINSLAQTLEQEILRYRSQIKVLSAMVVNEETAYLRVEFPQNLADRAFPYKLKNYLTAYATRLGGLEVSVFGYGEAFSTGFGGAPVSFAVTAKGFNYNEVKRLAEDFRRALERNPRVANVDIDRSATWGDVETFEQTLSFRRDRLQAFGASVSHALPTIRANAIGALGGSSFRIGSEEISYDVKYAGYKERQASDLLEQEFTAPGGATAKIGAVATLTERKMQAKIFRENRQYIRAITFEFQGPYRYGDEFLRQTLAAVPVRAGYSLTRAGDGFFFGDEQTLDIAGAVALSALLIAMISAALFESFRFTLTILSAVPIAMMGAVYSLWYFGLSLDRGAFAGMLLLIALAVNIATVFAYHILRAGGGGGRAASFSPQTLVETGYKRLRPVLATACVTMLAMLPLVLQTRHGFWQTLGATVLGGVAWSSLFLMFFVPLALGGARKRTGKA
jgi:multidrug efflux pump subunit AcrB